MWWIVIYALLFFVMFAYSARGFINGEALKAVFFGVLAIAQFGSMLWTTYDVGVKAPRVVGGHHYEVVVATSAKGGGETLIYAIDIKSNKKKADILDKYPMDRHKIEKIGGRMFHIPASTVVVMDNKKETFFVTEEKEVIEIPVATMGK